MRKVDDDVAKVLFEELRRDAKQLRDQYHATAGFNNRRAFSRAALKRRADRFAGAFNFVGGLTGGIPKDERHIVFRGDRLDIYEIYLAAVRRAEGKE